MQAPGTTTVHRTVGFGWCHSRTPEVSRSGVQKMTYRYLPPGIWCPNLDHIPNLLNAACKLYATYEHFPPDLILKRPKGEVQQLTKRALAFYETCPVYAELTVEEGWLWWKQFTPGGDLAYTARANSPDILLGEAIRNWPMNEWANFMLAPWQQHLDKNLQGDPIAMEMQPALPEPPRNPADDWGTGVATVPTASPSERTELPLGLFKVTLVSCHPDRVKDCKKMKKADDFEFLPCTMAVRYAPDEPFHWKEHYIFRFECATQFIPRVFQWTVDNKVALDADWAVSVIQPCHQWDYPHVKFDYTDDPQWDVLGIFFEPLAALDAARREEFEHDLATLPRPPR
ncbi:MAG: hypothetical protein K1X67_08720 [Fimbriimonadaceae bacterium]|nr:hypothetical protein [Fimbriimonadaceae bacterium]